MGRFCGKAATRPWSLGILLLQVVLEVVVSPRPTEHSTSQKNQAGHRVAPYCAILRDYLSDTPLLRATGFVTSQHGQSGVIPPPHFLSVSPWRAHDVEVRYPPPSHKRDISAMFARCHMKARQNGCDIPLCDTTSKSYCAIWGVSRIGPLRQVIHRSEHKAAWLNLNLKLPSSPWNLREEDQYIIDTVCSEKVTYRCLIFGISCKENVTDTNTDLQKIRTT